MRPSGSSGLALQAGIAPMGPLRCVRASYSTAPEGAFPMQHNPALSADALAARFRRDGRLHIPHVLEAADAHALHSEAAAAPNWHFTFFVDGKSTDLDAEGWRKLDAESKQRTISIVHDAANRDFAYMHYKYPVYDRYHAGTAMPPRLTALFEMMNGDPFLDFARRVTGFADIGFCDAQLTAFGPGHFLTVHNDDLEGKNRRVAYVLNLTPEWREDWGGYLNFFDDAGHLTGGYKPAFNALNLFAIPARHSVGMVSMFARRPRIAISGWMRAGADPMRK